MRKWIYLGSSMQKIFKSIKRMIHAMILPSRNIFWNDKKGVMRIIPVSSFQDLQMTDNLAKLQQLVSRAPNIWYCTHEKGGNVAKILS
jgi:hypothetical protein